MTFSVRMDEDSGDVMERMVNLTLDILSLLTGETFPPVKCGDHVTIVVPSQPIPTSRNAKRRQKLLKLTNQMAELLTGEVAVRCQDVAVYLSIEEQEYLEGHKELYKAAMMEDQPMDTSKRRILDYPPHPMRAVEKDHKIPPKDQAENVGKELGEAEGRHSMERVMLSVTIKEEVIPTEISAAHRQNVTKPSEIHGHSPPGCGLKDDEAIGGSSITDPIPSDVCSELSTTDSSAELSNMQESALSSSLSRDSTFPCSECGRCFILQRNLLRHQNTHLEEKRFPCSECGKQFTQRRNLMRHQMTHSGEKPYLCSGCGKRFSRKAYLVEHERTAHLNGDNDVPETCVTLSPEHEMEEEDDSSPESPREIPIMAFIRAESDDPPDDLLYPEDCSPDKSAGNIHDQSNPQPSSGKSPSVTPYIHPQLLNPATNIQSPERDRTKLSNEKSALIYEGPADRSPGVSHLKGSPNNLAAVTSYIHPRFQNPSADCSSALSSSDRPPSVTAFIYEGPPDPSAGISRLNRSSDNSASISTFMHPGFQNPSTDRFSSDRSSDRPPSVTAFIYEGPPDQSAGISPLERSTDKVSSVTSYRHPDIEGQYKQHANLGPSFHRPPSVTAFIYEGPADQPTDGSHLEHSPNKSSVSTLIHPRFVNRSTDSHLSAERPPSVTSFIYQGPPESAEFPDHSTERPPSVTAFIYEGPGDQSADQTPNDLVSVSSYIHPEFVDQSIGHANAEPPCERPPSVTAFIYEGPPSDEVCERSSSTGSVTILQHSYPGDQTADLASPSRPVFIYPSIHARRVGQSADPSIPTQPSSGSDFIAAYIPPGMAEKSNPNGPLSLFPNIRANFAHQPADLSTPGQSSSATPVTLIRNMCSGLHGVVRSSNLSNMEQQYPKSVYNVTPEDEEKPFSCKECGKGFSSKSSLHGHMQVHTRGRTFACSECGKVCGTNAELHAHKNTHAGDSHFFCTYCQKGFSQELQLIMHQKYHTGERPFLCLDCGRSFKKRTQFTTHQRYHTGERPYSCQDCGKSFADRDIYKRHLKLHWDVKPYCCSECGKGFTLKTNLTIHQRRHNGDLPYGCPECGKRFATKEELTGHMATHGDIKPHTCSHCGKHFPEKAALTKHEKRHMVEKPYSCSKCDKSFIDRAEFVKHSAGHLGLKPYPCTECNKSFSDKHQLTSHQRCHTGERPFRCSECGKHFGHSSTLRNHRKIHTGERPYVCSNCGKTYARRADLAVHERTHTGERPFPCSECDKKFFKKALLTAHMRLHEPEAGMEAEIEEILLEDDIEDSQPSNSN